MFLALPSSQFAISGLHRCHNNKQLALYVHYAIGKDFWSLKGEKCNEKELGLFQHPISVAFLQALFQVFTWRHGVMA